MIALAFGDARLPVRFWEKVQIGSGDCWRWIAQTVKGGYGRFRFGGRKQLAHRVSYEAANGTIPVDKEIDHLCRNRACVNPVHLEAVTHQVNTLRGDTVTAANAIKTQCKHGHPLSGDNLALYERAPGRVMRICRACRQTLSVARSAA